MIDRSWKLQRYDRKDYSEVVEFPVEIVGRDGVVRRYSFEDSIRLYQRRISFAPVRYREPDLATAELAHCRSRVDQLRRSYFHRFGWAAGTHEVGPEVTLGSLAGELAAFLGRVLRAEGRVDVRIEPVAVEGQAGAGTWYVRPAGVRSGMLLYVYRLAGEHPDPLRERYFRQVKTLEQVGSTPGDTERLLAYHHTLDCAFVLSGDSDAAAIVDARAGDTNEDDDLPATPWEEATEAIRRGDHAGALRRCRQIVTDQPWHRQAYTAGALLALHADEPVVAEELALLGTRYFPGDPGLRYALAITWARQGRREEAEAAARETLRLDPDFPPARLLLAHGLAGRGAWREVRALTRRGRPSEDPALQRELQALHARGVVRAAAAALALALALAALAVWLVGAPAVAVGLAVASFGSLAGFVAVSVGSDRGAPPRLEELRVSLRRVVRRDGAELAS